MELFNYISQIPVTHQVWFWICFIVVCTFCCINGFNDTANSVATIIYTNSLKPLTAVIWSAIWNFLGLLVGGVAVALSLVKLVPLLDILNHGSSIAIIFLMSFLLMAIVWNLSTWRKGLPSSSSHTLIGSLIGASLAFWWVYGGAGVNWSKVWEITLSLFVSPVVGFGGVILVMWLMKKFFYDDKGIQKEIFGQHKRGAIPPFWVRFFLVLTGTAVSFSHGSNDGQKGVGLLLLVLYIFLPSHYLLNPNIQKVDLVSNLALVQSTLHGTPIGTKYDSQLQLIQNELSENTDIESLKARQGIIQFSNVIKDDIKFLSPGDKDILEKKLDYFHTATSYAPYWIIVLVSICLGVGTTIGRKKIVYTVGEKIGKTRLNYAEGMASQLVAAITIEAGNKFGLPVSTTHVLSSGIAGSMVAQGGTENLDKGTVSHIAMAWILTLPVTIIGSGLIFIILNSFIK